MERIGGDDGRACCRSTRTRCTRCCASSSRAGLIEGEWEHPERRSRRYYSLTDEGPRRVRAAGGGGAARSSTRSSRRSTRSCARSTGGEDGRARAPSVPLTPPEALRLWSGRRALAELRGGLRAAARARPRTGRPGRPGGLGVHPGRARAGDRDGRRERTGDRFSTQVFEDALTGHADAAGAPASDGSEVELSLDYELTQLRPARRRWPTRSSSAARSATRCAGRSSASRSRRRRSCRCASSEEQVEFLERGPRVLEDVAIAVAAKLVAPRPRLALAMPVLFP